MPLGRSESDRNSFHTESKLPAGPVRTVEEAEALIAAGQYQAVLQNVDAMIEDVFFRNRRVFVRSKIPKQIRDLYKLFIVEGLFGQHQVLASFSEERVRTLLPQIIPQLIFALSNDSPRRQVRNASLEHLGDIVAQREYLKLPDEEIISVLTSSAVGRQVLAAASPKFREPKSGTAILRGLTDREDLIALLQLSSSRPELGVDIENLLFEITIEDPDYAWASMMDNLGHAWPDLSVSRRWTVQNFLFKKAAEFTAQYSVYNYYLDILEHADLLALADNEQLEAISISCPQLMYCLEYLQTGIFSSGINVKLADFAASTLQRDRRSDLVDYYLQNDMFVGLLRLDRMMPEFEIREKVGQHLRYKVRHHLEKGNYWTAQQALNCMEGLGIEDEDDASYIAEYGAIDRDLLEAGFQRESRLRQKPRQRKPFPVIEDVPRDFTKFFLYEHILSEIRRRVGAEIEVEVTAEGASIKQARDLSTMERVAYSQLESEAKAHINSMYLWMRQYIIIAVQKELRYQRFYDGDAPHLLPYGRDLATTGTPEEIRLFFQRAASFFAKHNARSKQGKRDVVFGGKNWSQICTLGYNFWSYDGSPEFIGRNSVIKLVHDFIHIRHNSGYLLNDEPRAFYTADIDAGFLDVISETTQLSSILCYCEEQGCLSPQDKRYFTQIMTQLGLL